MRGYPLELKSKTERKSENLLLFKKFAVFFAEIGLKRAKEEALSYLLREPSYCSSTCGRRKAEITLILVVVRVSYTKNKHTYTHALLLKNASCVPCEYPQ